MTMPKLLPVNCERTKSDVHLDLVRTTVTTERSGLLRVDILRHGLLVAERALYVLTDHMDPKVPARRNSPLSTHDPRTDCTTTPFKEVYAKS